MTAVEWAGPALSDLAAIRGYIEQKAGPHVAQHTVGIIRKAAISLARFPGKARTGRVSGTRELVVQHYIIVYRVAAQVVQVLRVLHGAQRWPQIQ